MSVSGAANYSPRSEAKSLASPGACSSTPIVAPRFRPPISTLGRGGPTTRLFRVRNRTIVPIKLYGSGCGSLETPHNCCQLLHNRATDKSTEWALASCHLWLTLSDELNREAGLHESISRTQSDLGIGLPECKFIFNPERCNTIGQASLLRLCGVAGQLLAGIGGAVDEYLVAVEQR